MTRPPGRAGCCDPIRMEVLAGGMAASRDSTTTGRRPISGSSHHHTSPRAGGSVTSGPRTGGTMRDRPTHRAPRGDDGRRRGTSSRSRRPGAERAAHAAPRPPGPRRSHLGVDDGPRPRGHHRRSYSGVLVPCHNCATAMPSRIGGAESRRPPTTPGRAGCGALEPAVPARAVPERLGTPTGTSRSARGRRHWRGDIEPGYAPDRPCGKNGRYSPILAARTTDPLGGHAREYQFRRRPRAQGLRPVHLDCASALAANAGQSAVVVPVVVECAWLIESRLGPVDEAGFLRAIDEGELDRG